MWCEIVLTSWREINSPRLLMVVPHPSPGEAATAATRAAIEKRIEKRIEERRLSRAVLRWLFVG